MTHPERPRLLFALRVCTTALLVAVTARALLFTTYRVSGASMVETLQDGDRILVGEADWIVHPLETGDTIVFEVEDEVLVKRVVGCPGDRVSMRQGVLVRNGVDVPEQILPTHNAATTFPDYRLATDEYFVLGDNRRVSVDSRDFGPVQSGQVLGRVLLRMNGRGLQTVAALERR